MQMPHKDFLKALQTLAKHLDKLIDIVRIYQILPNFLEDEIKDIAYELQDMGTIKIYNSGKTFKVSLTLEGKHYLEVLEII